MDIQRVEENCNDLKVGDESLLVSFGRELATERDQSSSQVRGPSSSSASVVTSGCANSTTKSDGSLSKTESPLLASRPGEQNYFSILLDPSAKRSESPTEYDHTRRPRRSFDTQFKLSVVDYYKSGSTKAAAAKAFGIHRKRVQEWIQKESILRSSPKERKRVTRRFLDQLNVESLEIPVSAHQSPLNIDHTADVMKDGSSPLGIQTLPPPISETLTSDFHGNSPVSGAIPSQSSWSSNKGSSLEYSSSSHLESAKLSGPSLVLQSEGPHMVSSQGQDCSSSDSAQRNIRFLKLMDEDQVGRLLDAMNLSKYKEKFLEEQVDGELLSCLGDEELLELKVDSRLHRLRLLKLRDGTSSAADILHKHRMMRAHCTDGLSYN